MGKRGRFRFPVMILRKNANHYLPQKYNLNIFLQFQFHNQPVSSLSSMGIQNIKEFIKNTLRIKEPAHILSDHSGYRDRKFSSNMIFRESGNVIYQGGIAKIHSDKPSFSGTQGSKVFHSILGHESPAILFERDFSRNYIYVNNPGMHEAGSDRKKHTDKPSFSGKEGSGVVRSIFGRECPAILFQRDFSRNYILNQTYPESFYSISQGNVNRLLNQVNYIHVNNPGMNDAVLFNNDMIRNNNLHITNPQMAGMKSYLEQANMQNIMLTSLMPTATISKMVQIQFRKNMKSYDNNSQNVFTFLKPFIKNPGYTIQDSLNSSPGKKGTSFMMKNDNYIFHKTREIDQEVDDIKKMVIETKNALAEKSTSILLKNTAKPNFDINRIADQVYQNIERSIRMERERRGM